MEYIWKSLDLYLFFISKSQGRNYEKNNMLIAEPGRNIWGCTFSRKKSKCELCNVKINSFTLKNQWKNLHELCSVETTFLITYLLHLNVYRSLQKPSCTSAEGYMFYKSTNKPFNKGCEHKLLHPLAWNPKTNLKIIHQLFDPGLPAISLLKECKGTLVQLAGLGTT